VRVFFSDLARNEQGTMFPGAAKGYLEDAADSG
jgi:hypothetical protein